MNRKVGSHKTASVCDYKRIFKSFGKASVLPNITRFASAWLRMYGGFVLSTIADLVILKVTIHHVFPFFQTAHCWAAAHKEQVKKIYILLILGTVGQYRIIHKCHSEQKKCTHGHLTQQTAADRPGSKWGKKSAILKPFCAQVLNWCPWDPYILSAKLQRGSQQRGGGVVVHEWQEEISVRWGVDRELGRSSLLVPWANKMPRRLSSQ